jgi:hypothetical protein
MQKKNSSSDKEKISKNDNPSEHVEEAYKQAEKDISKDAHLKTPPEEDEDLDEGELARKEGHP